MLVSTATTPSLKWILDSNKIVAFLFDKIVGGCRESWIHNPLASMMSLNPLVRFHKSLFTFPDLSIIPLEDIKQATNNFAQENIIQTKYDYGYHYDWTVYKGELSSGKKLVFISIPEHYMDSLSLTVLIDLTKHQNIVSFIGICDKDNPNMILVVEHPTRGGLDKYVSSTAHLTWLMRLQICLDIASALHFLHNHPHTGKIDMGYLDSASIHLDENWQAKIQLISPSALNYDTPETLRQTQLGYDDPSDRHNRMQLEIYYFGVILFELLCARPAVTFDEKGTLTKLACSHYEKGTLTEIIDPLLRAQMNRDSFTVFSELAYQCASKAPSKRPTISVVIEQLQKVVKLQQGFEISELQQVS